MKAVSLAAGVLALGIVTSCTPQLPPLVPLAVDRAPGAGDAHRDYRVIAAADRDLLIEVSGFESEFKVSAYTDDSRQPVQISRIPYLRAAPVYQVVTPASSRSEIRLAVEADHETRRAEIRVRAFELPTETLAEKRRAEAFRLYSQAIAYTESEAPEHWQPRIAALEDAARLFSAVGMTEQKLWSGFLAAYFTYFPMYDYRESIRLAKSVAEEADAAGFDEIALMAVQIQAQALLERDDADLPEAAREKSEQAQQLLDRAALLADSLGMSYEAAWALNGKGIGFYYRADSLEALSQYEKALVLAEQLEDDYFINMVRANMALAHENLGQAEEALELLQDIREDLDESAETNLVINNLTEQGRIYKNFYRFPESVQILSEARELARSIDATESAGRIDMSLARAYYEMGMMERSLSFIEDAKTAFEKANYGRGLREIYQISANIHRHLGHFETMSADRESQGNYLTSNPDRARHLYDRAMDLMSSRPSGDQEIRNLLEQGIGIAEATSDAHLQQFLRLELCRFSLLKPSTAPDCDFGALEADYQALRANPFPRNALSAMEIWADIQQHRGNTVQAALVYGDMLEDIAFYRSLLPGVLGAWYWERRKAVFESYLRLAIARDLATGDGRRSLDLLDRLRNVESSSAPGGLESENAEAEKLRGLLARRERSESPAEVEQIEREMDASLLASRRQSVSSRARDDSLPLQNLISALPADSELLAFYLFADSAYRWNATSEGVTVAPIDNAGGLASLVETTRRNLVVWGRQPPTEELARLGSAFFPGGPDSIAPNLYLLGSGPLNGFPFDTVVVGDAFLAESHRVVNLQTLAALPSTSGRGPGFESIFLAGNPVTGSNSLPELSAAMEELELIAAMFPSADITWVEGANLQRLPFEESRFRDADLIHIASHSQINLAYPGLSTIALSDVPGNADAKAFLTPLDIHGSDLTARLVVLSACETTGLNAFGLDANLGFVTAFLSSGAQAVVASLWALPDRRTSRFMAELYARMADGLDIDSALAMTKRTWISRQNAEDIKLWAAFQLYRQ